ncbi:MAG: MerR family transcriptional regulator [Thermoflexales bacterium]|nr:MerR family transcriptional regulator [Thermoflexales bacterium]
MFRIGDFSRLARVPIKTLRYYDEIGLLKPARVDAATDYRYYTAVQLDRLNRILAMKDLGLTLTQIKRALGRPLDAAALREMLNRRRDEIARDMQAAHVQLRRVEARLQQIELEDNMTTQNVVIKHVDAQWVASAGDIVPNYDNLGPVFDRLFGQVCGYVGRVSRQIGPGIALYRDDGSMQNVPVEACSPIAEPIPEVPGIRVYRLEGGSMASTLHHGPFDTLSATYAALMKWMTANGYRVVGPAREVYLSMDPAAPASWVTEIQFPVIPA